jgi:hypothetical protein
MTGDAGGAAIGRIGSPAAGALRTTRTGSVEPWTTARDTLPRRKRSIEVVLLAPTTTRSAFQPIAASRIPAAADFVLTIA